MPDKKSVVSDRICVIIVNWNAGAYLKRCVLSLNKQILPPAEVIIVDNASTDLSVDGLEECYPAVKVFRLDKNIGFAAANNYAARLASGTCHWLALLNPDAFPEPDWLASLMDAAREHPECQFFGSRLMNANQPSMIDGTGDINHISGLVWRDGHENAADASMLKRKKVFSPCGAAALYCREAFAEANGFDEDYFCYVEDVDLGFRLRLLGYRCLYVPESVVHHVGSATTSVGSDFSIYHGHRNLVWTYFKDMPGVFFWLFLPLHILLNFFSIIGFGLCGKFSVILRSKVDAFRGIPPMWKKRRAIQKQRKVSLKDIWRVLDKSFLPRFTKIRKRFS